jgi:hypothetical protein
MCRLWGIQLKRERNEVCINPKGISPWVTFSAGRVRGVVRWVMTIGVRMEIPWPMHSQVEGLFG